jgi:ribosome biogenesis GTPase YqeH
MIRCEGCGVTIQTEDPKKVGYVPPQALEREVVYCQRCFRIRHYNEMAPVYQDPDVYLEKLSQIAQTDSLVVKIVDLFDLSGSWLPSIHRHIGKNPLLLLGNKIDLFPKSTKVGRLKEWVLSYAKEMGIHPVDVILISASKGEYVRKAVEAIEHYRQGKDVYVVGVTNVGKSTFINRLLKDYGQVEEVITTSPYPGTTLDFIQIPLDDGRHLTDTPGIVRKDRLSEYLGPEDLKIAVPRATLKPRIYQLNPAQTLFFGGLARFDFVEGERQPFVCYVANDLYIHRTKLERAEEVQKAHLGELLSPPKDPSQLPPWRKYSFTLTGKQKMDIVIAGLGWVACGKQRGLVHVYAPEGVQVIMRPAII